MAQTKPNAEKAASRRLDDQDFATYLPWMTLRAPGRRGKMVLEREPLFRSYLFVWLDVEDDPDEAWKRVNSTKAIQTLLPHSDCPLAIPIGEVESLQEAERAGNFVYPRSIATGARLRIQDGMLAGQVLECLTYDGRRGLVQALWDCLSRKTVVTIPLNGVRVL